MNIGNLIFTSPAWQKTLVRKTEKENKKIANTESSLAYNATRLKENLLQTYTNIYKHTYIYTYMHKHAYTHIYNFFIYFDFYIYA